MKRLFPVICLVLLFVSCAGDPAAPDDTLTQLPPEVSAEPVESAPDEQADDPEIQEESVPDEKPATPEIILSPEDESVDYYYPEPELTMPESIRDETESAVASGEESPVDTAVPGSDNTGIPDSSVEPKPKPEPPAPPPGTKKPAPSAAPVRPAAEERTASEAAAAEPEKTSPDETGPVMAEESVPDSVPELWADELRSSEPPPPVVRAELVPSRSVTVPRDGFLEVWYPGTGWVYLGDASGLIGVAYDTRKIENRDTLFTFRARRSGNYILEFSRYDVLTDEFMQDALAVTVTDPVPGKRTTVRAPDFTLAGTPEKGGASEEEAVTSTSVHDEPVLSAPLAPEEEAVVREIARDPAELLTEAQSRLASGDAPGALELLDRFFEKALSELDEGWYLRGLAYEANSAARNIRRALEAYETVVSAYPDSVRWKDADERIRYIKQFYFRVR